MRHLHEGKRMWSAAIVSAVALGLAPPAAEGAVDPLSPVSGPSPFGPGCNGPPQRGTVYLNGEVEPFVSVSRADPANIVGVWQQDRWSNGGSNGALTAVSGDGGSSWTRPSPPPFSRCAGGNAANNGDYDRATDPWVSFGPTGDAYQITLSLDDPDGPTGREAVQVSKSSDGGRTWGPIIPLIRDASQRFLNDKETITADPTSDRRAYAVWDRLDVPSPALPLFFGPALFSRTTNGGASWSQPRTIFNPGLLSQTIGNQIVVLPNGTLVNVFDLIVVGNTQVAVMRSTDQGATWSTPIVVDRLLSVGVTDPRDGAPVRTEDVIPEAAVDPRTGTIYAVWQDSRFTGGQRDQVALSSSTNGGLTWSPARRVSENLATQAFSPSVEVDGQGNVGVTYYDFTNDTAASPTLDTDYWFTRSTDGGRTFSGRERITPASFDMRVAPEAGGFFLGDYQGLASTTAAFKPFFVRANTGDTANRTDVFATTVSAPFPAPTGAGPRGRAAPRALRGTRLAHGVKLSGPGRLARPRPIATVP